MESAKTDGNLDGLLEGRDMAKYIVRAADGDFVEKEAFNSFDEALAYADRMGEVFGSWNVDMYSVEE